MLLQRVMRYVYEGVCRIKPSGSADLKSVKHLLGAAHYFQLDGLKRKCEIMLSKNLSMDNCVSIYKSAKVGSLSCNRSLQIGDLFSMQYFYLLAEHLLRLPERYRFYIFFHYLSQGLQICYGKKIGVIYPYMSYFQILLYYLFLGHKFRLINV